MRGGVGRMGTDDVPVIPRSSAAKPSRSDTPPARGRGGDSSALTTCGSGPRRTEPECIGCEQQRRWPCKGHWVERTSGPSQSRAVEMLRGEHRRHPLLVRRTVSENQHSAPACEELWSVYGSVVAALLQCSLDDAPLPLLLQWYAPASDALILAGAGQQRGVLDCRDGRGRSSASANCNNGG